MRAPLRCERGGILALTAVIIPAFLLLGALVLDTGNWYTHKRSLQNRADAGALAAGVEYVQWLSSCRTNPGVAGAAIADEARLYAGGVAGGYNQTVNEQVDVTVDVSDPCESHAPTVPPDPTSPAGGIWTDVTVRESDIGTLAGTFGIDLPSITAQARVEVKQLTGVRSRALPSAHESGDYTDCVWARFVNARTGDTVSLAGGPNPVPLTPDPDTPRRWTADVAGIDLPNGEDDVAVEYSLGVATGGDCDFSTPLKTRVPGTGTANNGSGAPVPLDWVNVFDDDNAGGDAPPLLHHFRLGPGSCGPDTVAFISSPIACTLTFSAEVEHGPNPAPTSVTISSSNPEVAPVDALPTGSSGTKTTYVSQIGFDPNEVSPVTPARSQNYSQVGQHLLTASWTMTSGTLTSGRLSDGTTCTAATPCLCTAATPCVGEFESELPGNTVHSTYVADPVSSVPLVSAELKSGDVPLANSIAADGGPVGPFEIVLTMMGVDKQHIVIVRGSAQGTGSRNVAVDCGQGSTAGNCPQPVMVNARGNQCVPPVPTLPGGGWDCVRSGVVDQASIPLAATARFASPCSPNNWDTAASPANLNPSDPRFVYVFLTSSGRVQAGQDWLPVQSFARFYVTGGDGVGCPDDDPEPRGTGSNPELWGHLVDVITVDDDVIAGDDTCDLDATIVTCKPSLVR